MRKSCLSILKVIPYLSLVPFGVADLAAAAAVPPVAAACRFLAAAFVFLFVIKLDRPCRASDGKIKS